MQDDIAPIEGLTRAFGTFPGVGRKSARRMAYAVVNMPQSKADELVEAMRIVRSTVRRCTVCCDLTDAEICTLCRTAGRDQSVVCVVENSRDVRAILRTHSYNGLFHVLQGCISPLDGIGPEDLTIKQLIARLEQGVQEIILATNATVEGEATAMYLARFLKPFGIAISRLAYGIPVGSDLEYADEVTLARALEGRRQL
jgi:recombination protein RecR